MKRVVALLAVVVAFAVCAAAFVGPCAAPADDPDAPHVDPAQKTAEPAVPSAPRPRVRAAVAETDAADDDSTDRPHRAAVGTATLHVRVVDAATDAPIAGASVGMDDRTGTTDAAGVAVVEGVPDWGGLAEVRARGYARKSVQVNPARKDPPQTIRLEAGVIVRIEVVDAATGRPVAGAKAGLLGAAVFLVRSDPDGPFVEDVATDENGRAEATLPPSASFLTTTRARGHVTAFDAVRTAPLGAPQPTLRVALAAGGTLRGVVSAPDGAPVAGADVTVTSAAPDANGELERATTGPDGAYSVDGLVLGAPYVARADPPDHAPDAWCQSEDSAPFSATATSPECVADLRIRRAGTLAVKVVDEDGGSRRGVFTQIDYESGERSSYGGNGGLSDVLAPGICTLRVWADDRVPVTERLTISEGEQVMRTVRLTTGESIAGTVVDEDGDPVRDVWIRLPDVPGPGDMPRTSGHSNQDGHFAMSPLTKGVHDVIVDPPYDFEPIVVPAVAAPAEGVQFVVRRRGTLALRIVLEDESGNPVRAAPDARIAFQGTIDGEPWHIDRTFPDDGGFEVAWPARVTGDVQIAVDGFLAVTRGVSVPVGAAVDLGEVRFRAGCSLRGVLRDADGKPVPRCDVFVREAWRGGTCTTDPRGAFSLRGLRPGSVRIDVASHPPCSFRVNVPRRDEVVLTIPRHGALAVVVLGPGGAPAAGRRVVVRDAEGVPVADGTTDIHGNWLTTAAPGRVLVEVEDGPRAEAEIRPDDLTLVRLR